MTQDIVITANVLNTLRSLPFEERMQVASALTGEVLLGTGPCSNLKPEEEMIYSILRFYVQQASSRYNRQSAVV